MHLKYDLMKGQPFFNVKYDIHLNYQFNILIFQHQQSNPNTMEQELEIISKKFKQNYYYTLLANTSTNEGYRTKNKDYTILKQQIVESNERVKALQSIMDCIINDGIRMNFCYDLILQQHKQAIDNLKEELEQKQRMRKEQKLQAQKMQQQINEKLQQLKRQILMKDDMLQSVMQKYEQLTQSTHELRYQQSKHVKQIKNQLIQQSLYLQHSMQLSQRQVDTTKIQLAQQMTKNQQLKNQNILLKLQIDRYIKQIQNLSNKRFSYKKSDLIKIQDRQQSQVQFHRQEINSIKVKSFSSSQGDKVFYQEEIYINGLPQINYNRPQEKQILNISQHFVKFNRTMSRVRDSEEMTQRFFAKNNKLTSNPQLKIDIICSKAEVSDGTFTDRMLMLETSNLSQIQDPYRSFFLLLVQCEKLNSPNFNKISHIKLSNLYDELKFKKIPFNKWQLEIRKALQTKLKQKNKTK